ncbi:RpiB/LacA/LacB family sugar-phosphate isomerase [Candidatus Parcubacteria bacterium]|uniref:Ribose-5-phosphate isomerase n=1 Tax=Candidatus Kaiserbacteria bacterium CG10_big_fil_rev_8_21_14_0_10_47_16 TaxID=1974608 RepID=A0A2H0UE44_9BACT|nr:RpiB/LacA/LacB family sugar-phosphate isomerase [Candidatus Parcubacteria bacterium]PIR84693.1 MAG: ribose-5-phosphate isomerase [Candidatus Kaiserbacteria bacterium CG10_big_fil_rev_8_21_14_0_10_47_16]
MKIYFAADHAGFELKEVLRAFVRDELGYETEDCGAFAKDIDDDYPDFVRVAAEKVAGEDEGMGIILGGSGQGEAIAANRTKGVRAAVYYGGPEEIVTLSREHNDANMLSLGARFMNADTAKEVVRLWLATEFSGDERHIRRLQKVDD